MSDTKFTPGPWERVGAKVLDQEGFTIAKCGWIGQSDEEGLKNGDLIAAAPEMYAMLERIMDYRTGGPFIANPTKTEEIYNLLAKARGEVRE